MYDKNETSTYLLPISEISISEIFAKNKYKKEDVGLKAPALHPKDGYGTSSTISISDFQQIVNNEFP